MEKKLIVLAHAGLCNRLLPLVSGWRASEILNRKLILCWAGPPRRTGMPYQDTDGASFNDLFENPIEQISIEEVNSIQSLKWFADRRGMNVANWKAPPNLKLKDPQVIRSNIISKSIDAEYVAVRTSRFVGVEGDQPTLGFLNKKRKPTYRLPK